MASPSCLVAVLACIAAGMPSANGGAGAEPKTCNVRDGCAEDDSPSLLQRAEGVKRGGVLGTTPPIPKVCSVGDHVMCPYSDTKCAGNQCCPRAAKTGNKTYPCPSSDGTYSLCEKKKKKTDCTIAGLTCGGAGGVRIAALHNADCSGFCFQAPVEYVETCLCPHNQAGVVVPPGPATITDPVTTEGRSCLEACPNMVMGVAPDAWYKMGYVCAAYAPGAWKLFNMTKKQLQALTPEVLYTMGADWRSQYPQCA